MLGVQVCPSRYLTYVLSNDQDFKHNPFSSLLSVITPFLAQKNICCNAELFLAKNGIDQTKLKI